MAIINSIGSIDKSIDSREDLRLLLAELDVKDIITTSPGTETTPKEDNDGIWDLDLG